MIILFSINFKFYLSWLNSIHCTIIYVVWLPILDSCLLIPPA
jgi:hypothetical protein